MYTVSTVGVEVDSVCCTSELVVVVPLGSATAGMGNIDVVTCDCIDVGVDDEATAPPVPAWRLSTLKSPTTHLLCSSFKRRRTSLLLLRS